MKTTAHGWAIRGLVFSLIGLLMAAAFTLSGCASTAPAVREVTVVKEVPVPFHQPCPKAEEVPVVPKRVAEEHPAMPPSVDDQVKILAAKVLELFGYADVADAELTACSKPR